LKSSTRFETEGSSSGGR